MIGFEHFGTAEGSQEIIDPQRVNDFQATLLGMAGHDLRQPLQVIQSTYEWLGSRVATIPEKERLERGERAITRLTEQLDRLIGALHLHEHSKSITVSPVVLAPLFRRIEHDSIHVAFEKGVDLRIFPTTGSVVSHPVLLEGIVRNLVHNAIKYTEPGGRILIGCRRSGADLRIDVCDTGIGIAPEYFPKIFEAFRQLDSTRPEGLGLGLFVVRRAAQVLRHRIEVRSTVSRGARFSVFARASRLRKPFGRHGSAM